MAHSYTPGLKVTYSTTITKKRILPLKGDVVVEVNTAVEPETVVARTYLPGEVVPVNVANLLNIPPGDVPESMLKKEGDAIRKGEIIAQSKGILGLFKSRTTATLDGTIETISGVTGQVLQRSPAIPVEVQAYMQGVVQEVIASEGVVVATEGAFVQGIFGIGGETFGVIKRACSNPSEVLTEDNIAAEHKDAILAGGSLVTAPALKKAIRVGVRAIVVGGFDDQDLRDFLGYDIGVAITGSEKLGITLIVTEGFGRMDMAQRTFELLSSFEGRRASVNGATQIRAGVIRPEVIIPSPQSRTAGAGEALAFSQGLTNGTLVRIIRQPYFGRLGKVVSLPAELLVLESGSKARSVEVQFPDGERVLVPRANVELIEG